MSATRRYNQLLRAAMQRAVGAVGSDELLDIATGLAVAEGWAVRDLGGLTRKSVAQRLMHFERAGDVRRAGTYIDEHRRPSPMYVPSRATPTPVPPPPPINEPPAVTTPPSAAPAAIRALATNPQFVAQLSDLLLTFADSLAEKQCR